MSRTEILVAVGVAFLGVIAGYLLRGAEFRRAERLASYGAVAGTFQIAAYAGVGLLSLHMQLGDTMRSRPEAEPLWADWSEAQRRFRAAAALMRIVATRSSVRELAKLEDFIASNILAIPPFVPLTSDTSAWGEHARKGPRPVEDASVVATSAFANAVARDFALHRR